jgi:hypothetical protein
MAISLAEEREEVLDVLHRLADVLNGFHSEATIFAFLDTVFQKLEQGESCDGLASALVPWIEAGEKVPISKFYDRLTGVNFAHCNDGLPLITSRLLSKMNDHSRVTAILFKIYADTTRHSSWLVHTAFRAMHSEKARVDELAKLLGEIMADAERTRNAAFLLVAAAR